MNSSIGSRPAAKNPSMVAPKQNAIAPLKKTEVPQSQEIAKKSEQLKHPVSRSENKYPSLAQVIKKTDLESSARKDGQPDSTSRNRERGLMSKQIQPIEEKPKGYKALPALGFNKNNVGFFGMNAGTTGGANSRTNIKNGNASTPEDNADTAYYTKFKAQVNEDEDHELIKKVNERKDRFKSNFTPNK